MTLVATSQLDSSNLKTFKITCYSATDAILLQMMTYQFSFPFFKPKRDLNITKFEYFIEDSFTVNNVNENSWKWCMQYKNEEKWLNLVFWREKQKTGIFL